jgi:glycine oxidase
MGADRSILIVGGGVIGLAAALECRARGYEVTLIEKERFGGQASGAAAGMLAPFSENVEQPDEFYQLCRDSLALYEGWLDRIKERSSIDPEYIRSGSLNVVFHEEDIHPMTNRMLWQRATGARIEWIDRKAAGELEPALTEDVIGGLFYPDEAHIYAPAYVRAMEEACRHSGVTMLDGMKELTLKEWEQGIVLEGSSIPKLYGDKLVLCTGAWSAGWQSVFGLRWPVYPIRGQICAYPSSFGEVRHMVFTSQGYVVGKQNGSLVCGASEDVAGFDTTVTERGIHRLQRWGRQLLPMLRERQAYHTWAGLRPATQDGYPLLGPIPGAERVICAFGHYRNGILLSPVTARAVGDWVDGAGVPDYLDLFEPSRFGRA